MLCTHLSRYLIPILKSVRLKYALLFLCFALGKLVHAQAPQQPPASVFVWLHSAHSKDTATWYKALAEGNTLTLRRAFKSEVEPLNRIWVLEGFRTESEADRALGLLLRDTARVQFAEKVPLYSFFHTPNDLHSAQWNLKTIAAEQAWDLAQGGRGIVVGLVDDGMDTAHSDLQPTLWHNAKEIAGNGTDDDGNGYIDDVYGWDVADNDADPHVKPSDNLKHGTHCAGIVGARTHNSNGIASIGYNLSILPIKCGQNGSPFLTNPYEGVEYCINQGVRVISMSWGGGSYSATYQALFDYAASKNVICVAAAGNSSTNRVMYPAGFNKVIAVGSTASGDGISGFSNYGTWVDVMAPGSTIYSTLPGNSYGNLSGTSMACPLVSGLCALMISKNPNSTAAEIEACLKSGCENINAKNPNYVGQLGAGRINAYKSLLCLKAISAEAYISKTDVCTQDTVLFINTTRANITAQRWTFEGGLPASSTASKPIVRYNSAGQFKVKLWVSNGKDEDSMEYLITVGTPEVQFSGKQSVYAGDFGTIVAQFSGRGPWDLEYTDGSQVFQVKGIQNTPYYLLVKPTKNTTYKPLTVQHEGCAGNVRDSSVITVLPAPTGSNSCDSGYRIHLNMGGTGTDYAIDIHSYNDSTAIVVGKTQLGAGNGDGFVCRLNLNGSIEWFKTFGGTAEDGLYTVVSDAGGSIYAGGYTYSDVVSRAAVMMKLDGKGNQLWRKVYGNNSEYIYNVSISKSRKHVYFTGMSIDNSYGSEDFTVYKLDSSGSIAWVKQIGEGELNRNHTLAEDANGKDLYVIGNMGDPHPRLHGAMTKLSEDGTVQWTKKFQLHDDYQVSLHDIKVVNANELLVYGFLGKNVGNNLTTTREFFVARMYTNGSVIWAKKYVYKTSNPWRMDLIGNKILLSGGNDNNGGDGYLVLLDSLGNVLQARNLGGTAYEFIYGVSVTPKQEILFAGQQYRKGYSLSWVGKTGCRLGTFCEGSSFTPVVSNLTLVSTNITYNVKDFSSSVNPNHAQSMQTPGFSIICQSPKNNPSKPPCDVKVDFDIEDNCFGDTVVFKDKSSASKYTPTVWQWSFGDGGSASGTPATHVYTAKKAVTVRLKVISVLGGFTCIDSMDKIYTVSDSFRMLRMSRDTTICLGDSVQLSAIKTVCGEPLYTYTWTPISIDNNKAAQPWVSPKTAQQYTVVVKDGRGQQTTGKVMVAVNRTCCVSKARMGLPATLCEGDSLIIRNLSTAKSNASYEWRFPGSNVPQHAGKTPPPVVYSTSGVYTITLVLRDACSTDTSVEEIFIFPKPPVFAGRDSTLCAEDTLQLGAEAIGRSIYSWTPSTGLDDATLSNPKAVVGAPIAYILRVISEEGCRNADTVRIGFGLPPAVNLGKDSSLCYGEQLLLLGPDIANAQYRWSTGATGRDLLVSKGGSYRLAVTNACGTRTDTIQISMTDCLCPIYVPSAFSPTLNGVNDKFEVVFSCPYLRYSMKIYNRWGEKLFESDDLHPSWDGRYKGAIVPADMYAYILEIESKWHFGGAEFNKSGVVYVLE